MGRRDAGVCSLRKAGAGWQNPVGRETLPFLGAAPTTETKQGPRLRQQAAMAVPSSSLYLPLVSLLGRGGGAAHFRRTGRKAAWAGDAERQHRRACSRSARLVARLLLLQSLELSLGVFVKYGATLASQKSLFFSVRGKRGGGREQNFKTMTNVRVLTWLR